MRSGTLSTVGHLLVFFPFYLLVKILGHCPRSAGLRVGETIGRLAFHCLGRRRAIARENLDRVYGRALPASEKEKIALQSFVSLGRLLADFSFFPRLHRGNIENFVEYSGYENFRRAHEQGRGLIYLCCHFGSWELMSYAHAVYGHPLSFVARPVDNPYVERMVRRYRELRGNRVLSKWDATRSALQCLRKGEALGILLDQYVSEERGVSVSFLGTKTGTATITAVLALKTEVPVVPVFLDWDASRKKHILHFDPEVEVTRTGDRAADIAANTEKFNEILGRHIQSNPSLWLWCHRRWR